MKQFSLDGARLTDRKTAHDHLMEVLPLPEHYGRNLDALFDCLTEFSDCTVTLQNVPLLQESIYGQAILNTFRDAAAENSGLTLLEVSSDKVTNSPDENTAEEKPQSPCETPD